MLNHIEQTLLPTVYFGPQGFLLLKTEEEQVAYQQQFSDQLGWPEHWFVIGIDTELGDPYLISTEGDSDTVSTAIFDGEQWSLIPVAVSIQAFIDCLTLLNNATEQTAEVIVPDDTTITDREVLKALEGQLNSTSQEPEFWQQFIACYIDWLEEE